MALDFGKIDANPKALDKISADIESGRFSHAVLLTGKNNDVREKTALAAASALLCEGDKKIPCKKCPSCVKIKAGSHPDVLIVEGTDKKKSIKIDAVRDIRQKAYVVPNESKYKIFIILEASGMGEEAQNALLKVIEEPPSYTRFILCCSSTDSLLPTVQSRVAHYYLGALYADKITSKTQEKIAQTVDGIAKAAISESLFRLILSTAPMEKDRNLFKKCAGELLLVFRDALMPEAENLSSLPAAAKALAKKFSKKQLIEFGEKIKILEEDADRNANENLLLTRLALALKI